MMTVAVCRECTIGHTNVSIVHQPRDDQFVAAGFVGVRGGGCAAIFVYIAAMAYLLNNPGDPNRSQAAFDLAMKLS